MAATRPFIVLVLCALIAVSVGACGGGAGAPGLPSASAQRPDGGVAPAPLAGAPVPTQTPPRPSKYLPSTWNGLFTMQVFDNHKNKYGISPEQAAADGPLYSAIWGSNSPELVQAWRTNNPTLAISMYQIIGTDAALTLFGNLGQPLSWWQANHPDWILYECDQKTIAYVSGVNSVPLDISNPDVVNYILNLVGGYSEQNGYSALGFDLVSLKNDTGGAGNLHGCGVITAGGWVQKFSGKTVDPLWDSAMLTFLSTARTYLHGLPHPLAIWGNNVPAAFTFGDPDETQVIGDLDVVLDESGFANYGKYSTDSYFNATVQWATYIQSLRKGFMDVNEWQEVQLTNAELDYALATYAMVKEQAAVVFAAPYGEYGEEHYFPQYATKIGPPCAEMYGGPSYLGLGRFAYYRQYRQALALVNTSPTASYTVKLPQKTYTDVASGATVTSPLSLGPNSGYLLWISKIGCPGDVH
ncbi:MAG TPA: hypothetical protein VII69_07880 [Candidatus Eremiobacteraceae bacterium]